MFAVPTEAQTQERREATVVEVKLGADKIWGL